MPYWILRRPNSPRSLAKSQVLVAKGEEVAGNFKLCCLSVGLSVCWSVCVFVCLICLPANWFLSFYIFFLCLTLSICLPVCLFICCSSTFSLSFVGFVVD